MKQQHPFHLVPLSPWPILTAFSMLLLTSGSVMLMHEHTTGKYIAIAGLLFLIFCMYSWWRDVIKEGLIGKHHTQAVQMGLRIGMGLFILSEIAFFITFFCSYFKSSIFPVNILDGVWAAKQSSWPPAGIETFDPWDIPFINTLILLLSGTTITWSHYALEENNQKDFITALAITIFLGIFFTCMQAYEYHHAQFKLQDGVYAANFYLATGFHGLHVIVGTIFLAICYFRAKKGHFTSGNGQLGFEFAAWYWHFVDVVWLFLFAFVYVWGR